MTTTMRAFGLLMFPLLALACDWNLSQSMSPSGSPGGNQTQDIEQFNMLEETLAAGRTQALDDSAMELHAIGDALFWKTYQTWAPKLHRRSNGATLNYGFSIGDGEYNNYRASTSYVVTAIPDGDDVFYRVYAADQTNSLVQEVAFPKPTDEQRWWAYAIYESTIYIVTTGSETLVYRWKVGQQPVVLTSLEDAGAEIGIFMDFDVDGSTLTFIESGRLWRLDLESRQATFSGNQKQILGGAVAFDQSGAVYEDATGLRYYDAAAQTTRDLGAEIKPAYKLNATYDKIHYFNSATSSDNFTRWKKWVIYTGASGIFAFHLDDKRVVPLLLNESDSEGNRIDYRYPVALDNGAAFFVGLTSQSGSVGAEGPVYQIDLNQRLN